MPSRAATGDGAPLALSCTCGQLKGHLNGTALRTGTHVVCFCPDCRAAELYFGQPDPHPDPVDLFQTTPDMLTITEGAENLGLMRLGPRGLLRWYATCCNAPLFNTLSNPRLAFVGICSARLADPGRLGPVKARGWVPGPDGKARHEGIAAVLWGSTRRMLPALLSGRWRNTPFFDTETGAPVVQPVVLSKTERAALYPDRA